MKTAGKPGNAGFSLKDGGASGAEPRYVRSGRGGNCTGRPARFARRRARNGAPLESRADSGGLYVAIQRLIEPDKRFAPRVVKKDGVGNPGGIVSLPG